MEKAYVVIEYTHDGIEVLGIYAEKFLAVGHYEELESEKHHNDSYDVVSVDMNKPITSWQGFDLTSIIK